MDAVKFLNSVEENSVDLAVIDPPYNMSKAKCFVQGLSQRG